MALWLEDLPYEERRIRRHTAGLADALDRWDAGPQTGDERDRLIRSVDLLVRELALDVDPEWAARLTEAGSRVETYEITEGVAELRAFVAMVGEGQPDARLLE